MFRLETLGSLALTDGPAAAVTTQRRRLALLALLAVAGERGLTRDKLVAYLWPDSSSANARHALEQLLYGLRRQLGDSALLGPDPLRLNPDNITSDVALFGQAIARGAAAEAVELYRGPFLDGFYLSDAAEFERWAGEERSHLARKYAWALEGLADAARDGSEHAAEIGWRRRLVATDPLNGGAALSLMHALASAGDGAGALQYARVYEALMREELDSVPDPPFMVLVQELRAAQAAAAAAVEPAPPIPVVGTNSSPPFGQGQPPASPVEHRPTAEQDDRALGARERIPRRCFSSAISPDRCCSCRSCHSDHVRPGSVSLAATPPEGGRHRPPAGGGIPLSCGRSKPCTRLLERRHRRSPRGQADRRGRPSGARSAGPC